MRPRSQRPPGALHPLGRRRRAVALDEALTRPGLAPPLGAREGAELLERRTLQRTIALNLRPASTLPVAERPGRLASLGLDELPLDLRRHRPLLREEEPALGANAHARRQHRLAAVADANR